MFSILVYMGCNRLSKAFESVLRGLYQVSIWLEYPILGFYRKPCVPKPSQTPSTNHPNHFQNPPTPQTKQPPVGWLRSGLGGFVGVWARVWGCFGTPKPPQIQGRSAPPPNPPQTIQNIPPPTPNKTTTRGISVGWLGLGFGGLGGLWGCFGTPWVSIAGGREFCWVPECSLAGFVGVRF